MDVVLAIMRLDYAHVQLNKTAFGGLMEIDTRLAGRHRFQDYAGSRLCSNEGLVQIRTSRLADHCAEFVRGGRYHRSGVPAWVERGHGLPLLLDLAGAISPMRT